MSHTPPRRTRPTNPAKYFSSWPTPPLPWKIIYKVFLLFAAVDPPSIYLPADFPRIQSPESCISAREILYIRAFSLCIFLPPPLPPRDGVKRLFAMLFDIAPRPGFIHPGQQIVLFGKMGNTGNGKKQGQWLSAPANPDQRLIPIRGRVTHVPFLRIPVSKCT